MELCGDRRGSPLGQDIGFEMSRKREVLHQTLYHFPFPETWKLGLQTDALALPAVDSVKRIAVTSN